MTNARRIREHVKHLQERLKRLLKFQHISLAEYTAEADRRDLIEH